MLTTTPIKNSLVLYKQAAARVHETGSKRITIELEDGQQVRVRPKDVTEIHPGPLNSLHELDSGSEMDKNELLTAWELLAGEETSLGDLAELAFSEFTPSAAWTVWKEVEDGLYFSGEPQHILASTAEQVEDELAKRAARKEEQEKWDGFVQRITSGDYIDSDQVYLQDIASLAFGEQAQSRILHALGIEQTPENAHDLLLKIGYWDSFVNPYPPRAGVKLDSAQGFVPSLAEEERRDLTHLLSLAIDDIGNEDPDDALSYDNGRIWVHVADVAALVGADSLLDLEARDRGANLYLPEKIVSMLPREVTERLGLGLQARSPALSIGFLLTADGHIEDIEITPSWINATRWSYEEAEERLAEPVVVELLKASQIYQGRRGKAGAIDLNLPETRIKVAGETIDIQPILPLRSREMVRDAMLMAGEAAALFAQQHEIAIPYTVQSEPTADLPEGDSLSAMFAMRKLLKPSRQSLSPGIHSGLGMEQYAQVTSPLRRYLDLVIHQQLRAFLHGEATLSETEVLERIGATAGIQRDLRRTERLSKRHWTLVYLLQQPDWQGEGILVEQHGRRSIAVLPDLDLETSLYLSGDQQLDSRLLLQNPEIDLARLETRFSELKATEQPG